MGECAGSGQAHVWVQSRHKHEALAQVLEDTFLVGPDRQDQVLFEGGSAFRQQAYRCTY